MDTLPHVVIIGGGFGGMRAARNLRDAAVRITLIDKSNHHLFQPLLYQVATAGLSAPSIAAPIRYSDAGALATIGRHAAVVEISGVKLWGLPAWLFWLFVHIFFLIDFRARVVVIFDWAWSYLTFERHARVVALPEDEAK